MIWNDEERDAVWRNYCLQNAEADFLMARRQCPYRDVESLVENVYFFLESCNGGPEDIGTTYAEIRTFSLAGFIAAAENNLLQARLVSGKLTLYVYCARVWMVFADMLGNRDGHFFRCMTEVLFCLKPRYTARYYTERIRAYLEKANVPFEEIGTNNAEMASFVALVM